jgi:type II secretory pathway pseudopilin PulG
MSRRRQSGYMLMVLVFMMALMMLAVIAVAPRVAQQVKRDREVEMIHRGAQYARAIKRFYRKYGRYPTTIDQLENTNNVRYLRKRYADPMVEDGKWKFLHPGDVKIGGGTNVGTPVSQMGGNTQQPTGLGGTNPGTGLNGANPGTSLTGTNSGTGLTGSTGSRSTTSSSGGAANSQIGGFIIGVASASEAEGIHEFEKKDHYNEWYFVYDPTTDRGALITGPYTSKTFGNASAIPGATPAGQMPGGMGQPSSGFGQPSSGFGQPIGGQPMGGNPGRPTVPKQ